MFNNAFKQFSFIEILLFYDRSDQHQSIYDSYNAEVAATQIKSIKLQNASNTYSKFNTVKFDLEDQEDQYTLYNAFTSWATEGSSIHLRAIMLTMKYTPTSTKLNELFHRFGRVCLY